MFFVEARYHRNPARAGGQVRYIAHREEGLTDGRRRELYGIGERFRAFRGDEKAIRKALRDDGRGLRNPVYFRFILTVDNPTAERFRRFDGYLSERVLRDAVEKTFRGAARGAQGACLRYISTVDRIARPTLTCMLCSALGSRTEWLSVRIQRIKERWEREVLYALERQERRLDRAQEALAHTLTPRRRDLDERSSEHVSPFRAAPRRDGQLELFVTPRRSLRLARGNSWTRQWLLFGRHGRRWEPDPEKAVRRAVFRLASRAMPKPLRELLWLSRTLRGIGLRQ